MANLNLTVIRRPDNKLEIYRVDGSGLEVWLGTVPVEKAASIRPLDIRRAVAKAAWEER